jgi:hypothetical protein
VGIDPTEGELLPCVVACLLEGVVVEASIVAVIMEDLDSMFSSILFKGKLGGKCFFGLVIESERWTHWRWLKWLTKTVAHL